MIKVPHQSVSFRRQRKRIQKNAYRFLKRPKPLRRLCIQTCILAWPQDGGVRLFGQIDLFPDLYDVMIADFKCSRCFSIAQLFLLHGFYYQLFKFQCVSFVRYALWHRITPHFLVPSILPYLSNKWGAVHSAGLFPCLFCAEKGRSGCISCSLTCSLLEAVPFSCTASKSAKNGKN